MTIKSVDVELSLRRISAANVSTPSEQLVQLSTDQDSEVRKAVSGNPNTPTDVLIKLGNEFPNEVVENPIFKILLLEEPHSRFIRLSLARSSTIPEKTLRQLSGIADEEILCAIAQNRATPISILEKLVHNPPQFYEDANLSDYDRLFSIVAKNPNTPVELLIELGNNYGSAVSYSLAENPNTPTIFLEQFARWRNLDIHRALMRNPKTPSSVLEILAGGLWPNIHVKSIQVDVRTHPNVSETAIHIANFIDGKSGTPQDVLEKLASDHRPEVRRLVAEHPNVPPTALEKLIQDQDKSIRKLVAFHPLLSASMLEKITNELVAEYLEELKYQSINLKSWESIFLAIMKHPNVTAKAVEALTCLLRKEHNHKNSQRTIIDALLQHEKLSESILFKLIQDPECILFLYRSNSLFYNPNLTTEFLEIFIQELLNPSEFNVINYSPSYVNPSEINSQQFENLTRQFQRQANETLTKYIAHPNVPPERLEQLSTHTSEAIRRSVAKNPSTPISVLQMLATHPTLGDRHAVAQNPNAPANLLLRLAVDSQDSVRGEVAKNPNTPLVILETLADDESVHVRSSLAWNLNIPNAIFCHLANDPNQNVRQSFVDNPKTPSQLLDFFADNSDYKIQSKIIQHPNTSDQTLLKFAENSSAQIRSMLFFRNANLSTFVLEKLATSTLNYIMVKDNKECNRDREDSIMGQIAEHPNTPIHILEQLATNQPVELYQKFGEYWFNFLRRAVASNPSTPKHVLEKLINDSQSGLNIEKEAAQKNLRNKY